MKKLTPLQTTKLERGDEYQAALEKYTAYQRLPDDQRDPDELQRLRREFKAACRAFDEADLQEKLSRFH